MTADPRAAVEPAPPSSFGQLLRARRLRRGLSLAQLATRTYFDKGHISKVETDKRTPSVEFAQACDRVLEAGNAFESIAVALSTRTRPAWPPSPEVARHEDPVGVFFAVLQGRPGPTAVDLGHLVDGCAEDSRVVLRALGLTTEQLTAELEQRTAALRSLVHGRKILVLLDGAADA